MSNLIKQLILVCALSGVTTLAVANSKLFTFSIKPDSKVAPYHIASSSPSQDIAVMDQSVGGVISGKGSNGVLIFKRGRYMSDSDQSSCTVNFNYDAEKYNLTVKTAKCSQPQEFSYDGVKKTTNAKSVDYLFSFKVK